MYVKMKILRLFLEKDKYEIELEVKQINCIILQNYDALSTTLSSESAQLQAEINETDKVIKRMEQKWQDLKIEYDRAELLLEKAREEMQEDNVVPGTEKSQSSLKETLSLQIHEQESIFAKLKNVIKLPKPFLHSILRLRNLIFILGTRSSTTDKE